MANWFCSSVGYTAVTAWTASTTWVVGDIRRPTAPTVGNERVFRCTTAGLGGASEPTWVNTKAATTTDNAAVWTEITGSSTYNTLTSFAAPHARLRLAAQWAAAGDHIYVANNHSATEANTITLTFPGTSAAPNIVLSIDPVTGLEAVGAKETATGAGIALQGNMYQYGMVYDLNGAGYITMGQTLNDTSIYDNCDFIITSASAPAILVGQYNAPYSANHMFYNCRFKFASVSQGIWCGAYMRLKGGSIISGGTTPLSFIINVASSFRSEDIEIDGFDFSNFTAGFHIRAGAPYTPGKLLVSNCKMPASWSGSLFSSAITGPDYFGEARNMAASDVNYKLWLESYAGTTKDNITTYMTGGATDGTTPVSLIMVSSANATFPLNSLVSPAICQRNELIGSAKTVTVEITHSAAADLTDAEVWLELHYLGTSGFPISTMITDRVATILGTAVAQTTSTQAWTGAGTRKQKLSVSVTPQEKGDFIAYVHLAKASTTIYVNPELVIT